MCGIFGVVSSDNNAWGQIKDLADKSARRGMDSSGLVVHVPEKGYEVHRADYRIQTLLKKLGKKRSKIVLGHTRLITNGSSDNQPVVRDGVIVIHNGIVVNHDTLWSELNLSRELEIDTEIIPAIIGNKLSQGLSLKASCQAVLDLCQGAMNCAVIVPSIGEFCLFSNNGSLFVDKNNEGIAFASEKTFLPSSSALDQVFSPEVFPLEVSGSPISIKDYVHDEERNILPSVEYFKKEEELLEYKYLNIQRCTKCILPSTMPYISFNEEGVCNYCENYKLRNVPKPISELHSVVEKYRRNFGDEVIVPFSGGRDSCFGLHLICQELGLKPVTYTYDWGMVTDLGRRNISRMCSKLNVENVVIAADIKTKRENIRKNLVAWLKEPHLGMISLLTAGDKHFFKYVDVVKEEFDIDLNIWGINPLEVTHFKSGFLGVPPDFAEERVYSHGWQKQLRYQKLRLAEMVRNPGYFNSSLFDTVSGEYYRSFTEKRDYYHIFDYYRWDEAEIDSVLINEYDWELATDTTTTWRIGDGTAAFYNYIYYTIAGFTEHDTFRSNQIREGQITREEALRKIEEENKPRYENIKWYLSVLNMDYETVIKRINSMDRLYNNGEQN